MMISFLFAEILQDSRMSNSVNQDQSNDGEENDFEIIDYTEPELEKSKSCPNCSQLNKKDEGSLIVNCFRCKMDFCWFCLDSLESTNRNLHDLSHSCFLPDWDDFKMIDWESQ